jgi:5,10-methenyltetrahydromethanopterin hydrogenase
MGGMDNDMDADPEMAADEMGAGDMDAEEELMEALRGISYTPSRKEVVNEVAKRVAKRLQSAKLHESKLNRALGRKRR